MLQFLWSNALNTPKKEAFFALNPPTALETLVSYFPIKFEFPITLHYIPRGRHGNFVAELLNLVTKRTIKTFAQLVTVCQCYFIGPIQGLYKTFPQLAKLRITK